MRGRHFRGNVFVGNLPPEFTEDELAESFDSYGIVLRASIARDPENGKRLRYGFVDIATERAANNAVAKMHGTQVHGTVLLFPTGPTSRATPRTSIHLARCTVSCPACSHKRATPATQRAIHPPSQGRGFLAAGR